MADILAGDIPYERQQDPMSNRMCGPAALCMVYRSLGIACSQAELAANIALPGPSGNVGARTYLLAQDALARGLGAIVFRARDPVRTLRRCQNRPLLLILNHRLRPDSPTGHFTVPIRITDKHVIVHDPQLGPNTRIRQSDLLTLWQPLGSNSEITGNILIAFAKGRQSAAPCPQCGAVIPDTIPCPTCRKVIPLQPTTILGCISVSCPERTWEALFCPYCDTMVTAAPSAAQTPDNPPAGKPAATPASPPAGKPAATDDDPIKIKPLNQEIDKFVALLLAASKGQPSPHVQTQITTIRKLQTELLDVQQKQAAERRAKAAAPAPMPAAPPPVPPPAAKPAARPPVDWNALGLALLNDLGLSGVDQYQRKHSGPSSQQGPHQTSGVAERRGSPKQGGMWS